MLVRARYGSLYSAFLVPNPIVRFRPLPRDHLEAAASEQAMISSLYLLFAPETGIWIPYNFDTLCNVTQNSVYAGQIQNTYCTL